MSDEMFELRGRTAVITGGGGVLGGSVAESLAAVGVRIALLDLSEEKLAHRAAAITEQGGEALAVVADVLDREPLDAARDAVLERFGAIDVLINTAGGNMPGATIGPEKSFFDLQPDDFRRVVDLNLHGTVLPTLVFGQAMALGGRGSIINVSSMAAQRPLTRVVGYSAAKAAVENFTRWLAVELARKFGPDLRVNAIAPGFFITEQNRRLLTDEDGSLSERGRDVIAHTPAGRFGNPEDLHGVIHWLCSDASRFVTGIVVPIDGGFGAFAGV